MKTTIPTSCFLFFAFCLSYAQITPKPIAYKKINFVYFQTSNIEFEETGIVADTVILKDFLTGHPYELITSPLDKNTKWGFISYNTLQKEEINQLISIISHTNYQIKGSYNVAKNKTTIYKSRFANNKTAEVINEKFHRKLRHFKSSETIDYKKNCLETNTLYSQYYYHFDPKKSTVTWLNSAKSIGTFYYSQNAYKKLYALETHPDLDLQVTPFTPFENCSYGIQKLHSHYDHIELISVNYE